MKKHKEKDCSFRKIHKEEKIKQIYDQLPDKHEAFLPIPPLYRTTDPVLRGFLDFGIFFLKMLIFFIFIKVVILQLMISSLKIINFFFRNLAGNNSR